MLKFYDFLFYLIYKFYAGKEKGAASSSAGIVGGLQATNVITVYMLVLFYSRNSDISKLFVIAMFLFFQVTTYIRYIYKENNSIQKMDGRWSALSESKQGKIRFISLIYICLSILLLFGVAGYFGSKR